MIALIEKYRGFDISFDTTNEMFVVESDTWDTQKDRKTFKACKDFVDDYIKNNTEFKPFKAQHKDDGKIILITGIRKDGFFVYEEKGKKVMVGKYNETNYMKYDTENDADFKLIESLEAQRDQLYERLKTIRAKFNEQSLKSIKEQYVNQE